MAGSKRSRMEWVGLLAGPVLSLFSFLAAYFVDPLNFGDREPLAAIPAFLLAIVVLLVGHNLAALSGLERVSLHGDRIYEAVRDYLHVTKVGSAEAAMQYILGRLPILEEVRNTSFSLPEEEERAEEKLYDTAVYATAARLISTWTSKGLRWKDVGDQTAVERLREIAARSSSQARRGSKYQYRLISHTEPQMNFVVLTYPDGTSEVLFNWDFRSLGHDPVVLLSRDRDIVHMFATHFEQLWRSASRDHDSTADSSTSTQ